MISAADDRHARYPQRRVDTIHEYSTNDEKPNNTAIVNRRHSIAHINFRRAIYRSLSLPQAHDESHNIGLRCFKYLMKSIFICIFIALIGFLIRLIWLSKLRK